MEKGNWIDAIQQSQHARAGVQVRFCQESPHSAGQNATAHSLLQSRVGCQWSLWYNIQLSGRA